MPKVAQQILEGAEKQAAEILAKAEEEASTIEKVKKDAAKKKVQRILREAEQNALETRKQIIAEARLSLKQMGVGQKSELITGVFEEAVQKLSKTHLSEVFLKKLAASPQPGSRLYVANRDLAWAKKNFKGEVLEAEILGGYILELGKRRANNSFEVILGGLKDEFSAKALRSIKG